MATINYCTLKVPQILFDNIQIIQKTPTFSVYKYKVRKGIIFRLPYDLKVDDVCHFFIEHEVNMSNTLRTGTLTLKVQITIIPIHIGLFSGYDKLDGNYITNWNDEDYGDEYFVPDYDRSTKRIVPLPSGLRTNLYEYLDEMIFKQTNDLDIINDYAVSLGCQKNKLKEKIVFAPAPEYSSATNKPKSMQAFKETQLMFDFFTNQNYQLLPENENNTPK